MTDVFEMVDTAKVYGQQAAASLAAIRAIDITDPAGMVETINDQVRALADALGFDGELSEVTGVAGAMGRVIHLATGEIEKFMDRKGVESDTERDEQQENIMKGLAAKYGTRSAWVMELESNALPGDDGYYTDVGGTGVPGIVTGAFGPALPLDRTSGCYRQGFAGRGKSAGAGAWRFWPALYPLCMNTTNLSFVNMTALQGRNALRMMVDEAQTAFSAAGNLWIDGEEVARTLSTFLAWARPGFAADELFSRTPIYKAGGSMGPFKDERTDSEGKPIVVRVYRTYVEPSGLLVVPELPADRAPQFTRWWGAGSFEPAAYNYVLQTCARWFAVRESLLRAPWNWAKDDAAMTAAKASREPSVQAALKRINDKPKVKRVGRPSTPVKGRHGTTTTPGPRPANARPEVKRVGRPSAAPTLTPERFDAIKLEMFPWLAGR